MCIAVQVLSGMLDYIGKQVTESTSEHIAVSGNNALSSTVIVFPVSSAGARTTHVIHSVRLPDPHHVYPAAADHALNVPEKACHWSFVTLSVLPG